MKIKSLGYRTDLIFPAFDGEIIDRGSYLVIRTPTNPTFYWGNFLLFSQPPNQGALKKWRDLFVREIGTPPEIEHQIFGWDSPEGDQGVIQPFLEVGFRLIRDVVLTCTEPHRPARFSDLVSIRTLNSESDWEQALENQVVCREPEFEESEYREYSMRQMDRYRKMVAAGCGDWYGAFIDQQLVADLGLFHDKSVGRYQSVETHPNFRRRRIAGSLVFEAGRQARDRYDLDTLVIVAEEGSSPARLYESLGFQLAEKQVGLEWWPQMSDQPNNGA